jgi:hypothetical protein
VPDTLCTTTKPITSQICALSPCATYASSTGTQVNRISSTNAALANSQSSSTGSSVILNVPSSAAASPASGGMDIALIAGATAGGSSVLLLILAIWIYRKRTSNNAVTNGTSKCVVDLEMSAPHKDTGHFTSISPLNTDTDTDRTSWTSKSPRSSNPFDTTSNLYPNSSMSAMSNTSMPSVPMHLLRQQIAAEIGSTSSSVVPPSSPPNPIAAAAGAHFRYSSANTQAIVDAHSMYESGKIIGSAASALGPFGLVLSAISTIVKLAADAKRNASNCRFFAARCQSVEPVIQRLQQSYTDQMVKDIHTCAHACADYNQVSNYLFIHLFVFYDLVSTTCFFIVVISM